MTVRILVVDDLRSFPRLETDNKVVYARTSKQALCFLETEDWDEVWLDHDLGEAEGFLDDVRPVVSYLEEWAYFEKPSTIKKIVVHTANSAAREHNIVVPLRKYYSVLVIDAKAAGCTQS